MYLHYIELVMTNCAMRIAAGYGDDLNIASLNSNEVSEINCSLTEALQNDRLW